MFNRNCRDYKFGDADVVFTANVRLYKNKPVLVIGNNSVIFLSAGDFVKAHSMDSESHETIEEGFIVRLNRNSKIYTFRNSFEDFCFEKNDTIESLIDLGRKQDEDKDCIIQPCGHLNFFCLEGSIDRL